MALAHYCANCILYFREADLTEGRCPDCGNQVKPRMVIGGVVLGAEEDANSNQWWLR